MGAQLCVCVQDVEPEPGILGAPRGLNRKEGEGEKASSQGRERRRRQHSLRVAAKEGSQMAWDRPPSPARGVTAATGPHDEDRKPNRKEFNEKHCGKSGRSSVPHPLRSATPSWGAQPPLPRAGRTPSCVSTTLWAHFCPTRDLGWGLMTREAPGQKCGLTGV